MRTQVEEQKLNEAIMSSYHAECQLIATTVLKALETLPERHRSDLVYKQIFSQVFEAHVRCN